MSSTFSLKSHAVLVQQMEKLTGKLNARFLSLGLKQQNSWYTRQPWWPIIVVRADISIPAAAQLCEHTDWSFPHARADDTAFEDVPAILETATHPMTTVSGSPIKYVYHNDIDPTNPLAKVEKPDAEVETVADAEADEHAGLYEPTFCSGRMVPLLIAHPPVERIVDRVNYRILGGTFASCVTGWPYYESALNRMLLVLTPSHRLYNWLDRGHVLCQVADYRGRSATFVSNRLDFNTYRLMCLGMAEGPKMLDELRDRAFFDAAGQTAGATLGRLEAALGQEARKRYLAYLEPVREHFQTTAQHVMVSRLQRKEIPKVVVNEIAFTETRAEYQTVSIEAPDLAASVFTELDTNSMFDIYQVVEVYLRRLLTQINGWPTNDSGKGFKEAQEWALTINGIPLAVSLQATNTRRWLNGKPVNEEELFKVMRRATCHHDAAAFNRFIEQISSRSLKVHEALAEGVPVKLCQVVAANYPSAYQKPHAHPTHPRVFFILDNDRPCIWLDKEKTLKVPLLRFVGLLRELDRLNSSVDSHMTHEASGYVARNFKWAQNKLITLLLEHIPEKERPLRAQMVEYLAWLQELRTEAEKKSKQLLDEVVRQVGAVPVTYENDDAFEVTGQSGRVYIVSKETRRVWNKEDKRYICIVDGSPDMGVGYDALVARMLALRNDSRVANKIDTLKL